MHRHNTPDPVPWKTTSTRSVFTNKWISVEIDEVSLPGKSVYEYTRLVTPASGVGMVGFNENGNILLEREYRHGVQQVIWQIPGGLATPNEDLQMAGIRELREETGYAPVEINDRTVRYLGCVWDNPAFGTMHSHLFAVWGLKLIARAQLDKAEFVTLHWVSPDWLKQAIKNGEIKDRVVITAVAHLLINGWI